MSKKVWKVLKLEWTTQELNNWTINSSRDWHGMKNSALFHTKPSFSSFTKNDDPIINTNKKVSKSADIIIINVFCIRIV